ncbi:G5 domain-containing protein [Subtercola sp. RTI3]|uniref:G5 domain-containing protein n=1 Tax=Subtercola sp. RTI3 TaxID=3048639 RepID=UPI002B22EF64|nr:G5 domain-containing protein [Subtercola sp. RTI3]
MQKKNSTARRMPVGARLFIGALIAGGAVLLLTTTAVVVAVSVGVSQASHPSLTSADASVTTPAGGPSDASAPDARAGAPASPSAAALQTPTPAPTHTPVVTHSTVTVKTTVPFAKTTVDDPSRDAGSSAITRAGQNGESAATYDVTMTDGVETSRAQLGSAVTTPPIDETTSKGTRQPAPAAAPEQAPAAPAPAADTSGCDPNYDHACVPIASDVDCAGGSGNGPAYVKGPVHVIGTDIYKLDGNGDGWGCE